MYLVGLIEQNMNSVERMVHYAALPEEGSAVVKTRRVPSAWPSAGALSFRNVDFAYRAGLPLVLKGVSFSIKSGEKVGIVGRTGAGKSSLLQAIFRYVVKVMRRCRFSLGTNRMAEIQDGSIEIDDINTKSIDLGDLRRRISLVPQESVLFVSAIGNFRYAPNAYKSDGHLKRQSVRARTLWIISVLM